VREPVKGVDYTERDTAAVHSVLIELAQVLGAQSGKFVLVGGSVPGLLFRDAKPEHIGTMDIDINLNPEALGDYGYVDMVRELESHGYERGLEELKPFQLLRTVNLDDGRPIKVIVDLLMPATAAVQQSQEKIIDGLTIQRISGGNIAIKYAEEITLKGKMPDGRNNEVKLLVATIPSLLVMKGYAIGYRDKEKDAYDIWYSIRHYKGGVEALAKECLKILDEEGVKDGYVFIAQKFKDKDGFGPQTVRKFLKERPDQTEELELEQIQTDAHLRVFKWCKLLGLQDE